MLRAGPSSSSRPGSPAAELVRALEQAGWGLLQLPPSGLHGVALERAMNIVLDQLHDWVTNGYHAVLIGVRGEQASGFELLATSGAKRKIRFDPTPVDLPNVEVFMRVGVDAAMGAS